MKITTLIKNLLEKNIIISIGELTANSIHIDLVVPKSLKGSHGLRFCYHYHNENYKQLSYAFLANNKKNNNEWHHFRYDTLLDHSEVSEKLAPHTTEFLSKGLIVIANEFVRTTFNNCIEAINTPVTPDHN